MNQKLFQNRDDSNPRHRNPRFNTTGDTTNIFVTRWPSKQSYSATQSSGRRNRRAPNPIQPALPFLSRPAFEQEQQLLLSPQLCCKIQSQPKILEELNSEEVGTSEVQQPDRICVCQSRKSKKCEFVICLVVWKTEEETF